MKLEITNEMKEVEALLSQGRNVFLSGSAGTGKSTFLNYYREKNKKKNILVVAPTGIAALNIQGMTIHSAFQFPFNPITKNDIKTWGHSRAEFLKHADMIVIDEISMVRADLLDGIDMAFRHNMKSKKHFGGKQVLLMGDVFQLEPVVKDAEKPFYQQEYGGVYFFNSKVYKAADFEFCQFTKVFRQRHSDYIAYLQDVRQMRMDNHTLQYFNERYVAESDTPRNAIRITSHNEQANYVNYKRLNELSGESKLYIGCISGQFKYDSLKMLTPMDLKLKLQAQVIFTVNDKAGRFRNGTIGTVQNFDQNNVYVSTKDNPCIIVERHEWKLTKVRYNKQMKIFVNEQIGSFKQFPLALGWAITIHKSQGQTYDEVVVDTGTGAFAFGQLYVALSRCTNYDGLYLLRRIKPSDIIRNQEVESWWIEQISQTKRSLL